MEAFWFLSWCLTKLFCITCSIFQFVILTYQHLKSLSTNIRMIPFNFVKICVSDILQSLKWHTKRTLRKIHISEVCQCLVKQPRLLWQFIDTSSDKLKIKQSPGYQSFMGNSRFCWTLKTLLLSILLTWSARAKHKNNL